MNSSFIRFAKSRLLSIVFIMLLLSFIGYAQEKLSPRLSETIKQIEAKEPSYGLELRRLANEVPGVRQALDAVVTSGATPDQLANLRKWDYVLPRAFENAGNDLETFKTRWPLIVKRSSVLCALRDENGVQHLVYCFGGGVPEAPKQILELIRTFAPSGETGDAFQTDSEADRWAIERDVNGKGDVLVLIKEYRVNFDSMNVTARLQKLRIDKNCSFELIEDKKVVSPWPPNTPDDLTYTPFYPGFKYPEPYDPKAPAPLPVGNEKNLDAPSAPSNVKAPAPPTPSSTVPTATAPKTQTPAPSSPTSEQPSSMPWALVVVVIAALAGLLWLMSKRQAK